MPEIFIYGTLYKMNDTACDSRQLDDIQYLKLKLL